MNTIFERLRSEFLVIVSADTLLYDKSIRHVVDPFVDSSVGMCWSKLVPIDTDRSLVNKLEQLAFRLHDRLSKKLDAANQLVHATGDIVSMRKELCVHIPRDCVNADEYLAIRAVRMGFKVRYLSEALCRASLPTTISDHVNQRRRWFYGHLQVGKMLGEYPTVLEFVLFRKPLLSLSVVVEELAQRPNEIPLFLALLLLELLVAALALRDILLRVGHSPWQVIRSTKRTLS